MTAPTVQSDVSAPSVNQFLLEALEQRWDNYRAELKRCRTEFSDEAIHHLRTAARRMLAMIQLLYDISPRPRFRKLKRAFKDQLDELDELRDTQVMLAHLAKSRQELPQLGSFQDYLEGIEQKLLKTARKRLKAADVSDISRRISKTCDSLKEAANENGGLVLQILHAVDDAFQKTKQRRSWVNPAQASTIHRVRVAFKGFRYMVEMINPLVAGFPPENLKRMHDYQTLMGEIQDVEVLTEALSNAPASASPSDPGPVRRHYERVHAEAVAKYMQAMDQLDTFWRSAPDQPFPWEK